MPGTKLCDTTASASKVNCDVQLIVILGSSELIALGRIIYTGKAAEDSGQVRCRLSILKHINLGVVRRANRVCVERIMRLPGLNNVCCSLSDARL